MKLKSPTKIVSLLIIVSCFIFVTKISAQERINITFYPTTQNIDIKPGETKRIAVAFVNNELFPVLGNLKVADFIVRENNIPKLIEDQSISGRYSASSWVTLPYEKANLPAKDRLIVYANVTAPTDALPGGHYASIYFETAAPATANGAGVKGGQTVITHQYGSLISFRVPGDVKIAAKVHEFSTNSFQEHGPIVVKTRILNEGYVHISPTGKVSLTNAVGAKTAEQALTPTNIFPEAISNYENTFGQKWMFGRYKVMLNATYNNNQSLQASTYVWVLPWKEGSVVLLALIILILLMQNVIKKSRIHEQNMESKIQEESAEIEKLKKALRNKE